MFIRVFPYKWKPMQPIAGPGSPNLNSTASKKSNSLLTLCG